MVNNFMCASKGLPRDDDRARFLDVKLSDPKELKQFELDGGMVNVVYRSWDKSFGGQAYDEYGFICLELPLKSVSAWRYSLCLK